MSHIFRPLKQIYSRLSTGDDSISSSSNDAQESPLMEEYSAKTEGPILRPRSSLFKPTVLAIALASMNFVWTMVLLLVTVIILFRKPMEPFREWHDTDIEAARPFIARTPVKFTTGLYWNETTGDTTFRVWNKNEPLYVGPRTSELDAAWDEITLPLDLFITEEEARGIPDIPQGIYRDPETGNYQVIVEAIHSLHCLNMLRRRIYLDEYPEMATPRLHAHVDHCIEALRMNLMCTADMTPAPVFYSSTIGKKQPNFEITHSCRNLRPLLEWARRRSVHQKYD